jgi:flagellar motor switch protein FliG
MISWSNQDMLIQDQYTGSNTPTSDPTSAQLSTMDMKDIESYLATMKQQSDELAQLYQKNTSGSFQEQISSYLSEYFGQ